jgi:hypothetical protein
MYDYLWVLKKIQIFTQNSYVLTYDFTENRQFGTKTDQNSAFLDRDYHILDRLYITIWYMSLKIKQKIFQNMCTAI